MHRKLKAMNRKMIGDAICWLLAIILTIWIALWLAEYGESPARAMTRLNPFVLLPIALVAFAAYRFRRRQF
jgi:hypothetical protein